MRATRSDKMESAIKPIRIETKKTHKYRVTFKAHGNIEMTDFVSVNGLDEALQKALDISRNNKWHIDRIDRVET